MNILYKIFAECHEFGSEEIIIPKPKKAMDRHISTHLRKRMALIVMGIQPLVLVEPTIWNYQMILLMFLIQTTETTTDVTWSSSTSLKSTLTDSASKNQDVLSKLAGVGAVAYLIRALQTLVNEGSDPKNICQTMLVLGQLFFGNSADQSEVDLELYACTLFRLYLIFDTIFKDCDNEIPRFNGEWLYDTTSYYLVVILHDIIATQPCAAVWLKMHMRKFAADSDTLKARSLKDSSQPHFWKLVSVLNGLNLSTDTLV